MSYDYYNKLSIKTRFFNVFRNVFKIRPLETWLAKMTYGNPNNIFLSKMVPAEYLYPNPAWRKIIRNGVWYNLNIANLVDHNAYFGFREKAIENFINRFENSPVVIDIGANIGITTLKFVEKHRGVAVFAYEPDATNFGRLKENIEINKLDRVSINNVGLGEKAEQVKLYKVSQTNPGMNRIVKEMEVKDTAFTTININTLDSEVFEKHKIDQLDAIKIDVEGYEYKVLAGGKRTLEKFNPDLLIELIDKNLKQNGNTADELIKYLKDNFNYKIIKAVTNEELPDNFEYADCQFDIIATVR